jgi:toxin-antitoxin system PIN domain toxin
MSDDLALVDTNVLVYSVFPESDHYEASRTLLDGAQAGQTLLCLAPQVLIEFYAVVTNPKRVAQPRRPEEAIEVIEKFLSMRGATLLPVPPDVVSRWLALARKYPVAGSATFDVQLVATMLGNGVRKIFTFDRDHFDRFDEVEAIIP